MNLQTSQTAKKSAQSTSSLLQTSCQATGKLSCCYLVVTLLLPAREDQAYPEIARDRERQRERDRERQRERERPIKEEAQRSRQRSNGDLLEGPDSRSPLSLS